MFFTVLYFILPYPPTWSNLALDRTFLLFRLVLILVTLCSFGFISSWRRLVTKQNYELTAMNSNI